MAGYPLQAGDNYYKLAADKAKEVIDSKKYTYKALLPDYFKKLIKTKRLKFLN